MAIFYSNAHTYTCARTHSQVPDRTFCELTWSGVPVLQGQAYQACRAAEHGAGARCVGYTYRLWFSVSADPRLRERRSLKDILYRKRMERQLLQARGLAAGPERPPDEDDVRPPHTYRGSGP